MSEIYWICLLGGLAASLVAAFVGDLFDSVDLPQILEFLLDPLSLVGGVAAFGAAGLVYEEWLGLTGTTGAFAAVFSGLIFSVAVHFVYVRPMKRSENSLAFSMREYAGRSGEVITSIPAEGCGEVLITMGVSNTFQSAASFDRTPIPGGARVVVVEVNDGVLWVSALSDEESDLPQSEALAQPGSDIPEQGMVRPRPLPSSQ
jgi:membrane protein implicated in regulation of membrane protease activity